MIEPSYEKPCAEVRKFAKMIGHMLRGLRARLITISSQPNRLLAVGARSIAIWRWGGFDAALRRAWYYRPHALRIKAKLLNPPGTLEADWAAPAEFAAWINTTEPSAEQLTAMTGAEFSTRPIISIILPVYRVSRGVLDATLGSITKQTYPHWEACITYADSNNEENWELLQSYAKRDSRFRLCRLDRNAGISENSNRALKLASGEFIALLDHDDAIPPWALYAMARKINEEPEADLLYSDHDCITENGRLRFNPLFKPEWSPEMLYSANYLTHFSLVRRSIVEGVGGFRSVTDGAQDWDLFFRAAEQSRRIVRVTGILYHWRWVSSSVSTGIPVKPYATTAQLRTIQDRLQRLSLAATAELNVASGFHIRWHPQPWQTDIVLHASDSDISALEHLLLILPERRVQSVFVAASPIVRLDCLPRGCARWGKRLRILECGLEGLLRDDQPLRTALSEKLITFVDSRVVRFGDGWLEELGDWCIGLREIAFAAAVVLDPEERIVEAGAVLSSNLQTTSLFRNTPLSSYGVLGDPQWYRNCSAANPWAVACTSEAFENAGGLPKADTWQRSFVALCSRLRGGDRRGLVNPYARVYTGRSQRTEADYSNFASDPYFHPALATITPLRFAPCGLANSKQLQSHPGP
jgi:hypothetical protein